MTPASTLLMSVLLTVPDQFDPLNAYENPTPGYFNATKTLYVPDVDILQFQEFGPGVGDRSFALRRVLQTLIQSGGTAASGLTPDSFFEQIWRTQCKDPWNSNPTTNCEPYDQNGYPTHCAQQEYCQLTTLTGPDDYKPLVLVNRVDMMSETSCGQARIVFQRDTVTDGLGGHIDGHEVEKLPLVIFEMNVPNPAAGSACPVDDGCRDWARRWAELSDATTMPRAQRRQALVDMYFNGYAQYHPVVRWQALQEGLGAVRIFGNDETFNDDDEWWNNDVYAPFFACDSKNVGDPCVVQWTAGGSFGGATSGPGVCAPEAPTGRLGCEVGGELPAPADRPLGFFQVNLSIPPKGPVGPIDPIDDMDSTLCDAVFSTPISEVQDSLDAQGELTSDSVSQAPAVCFVGQQTMSATPNTATNGKFVGPIVTKPRLTWHKGLLASAPHPDLFATDPNFFEWFLQRGVPALAQANHIAQMDLPAVGISVYPDPTKANTQDGVMYGTTDTQTYAGWGAWNSPLQQHVDLNVLHGSVTQRDAIQGKLNAVGAGGLMTPEQLMFRLNMASCVGCHDFNHDGNPAKKEASGFLDLGRINAGPLVVAYPEFKGAAFWFFANDEYFNPPIPCNEPALPGEVGTCHLPAFNGNAGVAICGATPIPGGLGLDWSTAPGPGTPTFNACQEARNPHVLLKYRGVLSSLFLRSTTPVCTNADMGALARRAGRQLAHVTGKNPWSPVDSELATEAAATTLE